MEAPVIRALWTYLGERYADWRAQPVIGGAGSRRGFWRWL
jgi:hypothetical protein